jgi:hypothetical protein
MVVDDMIPSEADQPIHGQQQAVLGASAIVTVGAPKVGAGEAARWQRQIGLQSDPFLRIAFKQVWPDFTTACLRTSGSEAKIIEARLVIAGR